MELSTLRLLREKGVISQAEYDSAIHDVAESSGAHAEDDTTVAVGKFAATLYGFIEADAIWDSTQSFNDVAGNALVAAPSSYAGSHSRVTFGARNSRFGVRIKAPEKAGFRASASLESDFEGATLPIGSGQPYYGTETAYFNSPTFRLRTAYVKFETPVVDILMGQYWHLYGWGNNYRQSTVQITGTVGAILSRTTQIRLSHTFSSKAASLEIALAALRPPQRNSGTPDGAAGFQLSFPQWTGLHTINSTGTLISPLSIAVSGDVRKLSVNELSATPKTSNSKTGGGISANVFIPIVPATNRTRGNSLSLTGEFSYGSGLSDLYTGLTGGVANPPLPNPTKATPAPVYTPDIDPGIAAYDRNGKLGLVQWTTFNVGLQYYFPGLDGRLWVAANYFRSSSANSGDFLGVAAGATPDAIATAQAKVRSHEQVYDVNVFFDPFSGVRFGLDYARFIDTFVSGAEAVNHRVQFSGFFIF